MERRRMVIITTRLPPQMCGIGSYSWLLYRYWPGDTSQVQFLVIDGAAESAAALSRCAISEFDAKARRLSQALDRAGAVDVLLHYAGRAYHRFGCPLWLPKVLARWKTKFPLARLIIFFHELPGRLPITSHHYWIDICNRRIIRKLAGIADVIVTNTEDHVGKIERISGRTDVHCFPVGSNIQPPSDLTAERANTEFVILGLPFGRGQTLQMFDREIRGWHRSGRLTRLHLVGPRDQKFDSRTDRLIAAWPDPAIVRQHGILPAPDVSKLLARVQFGLTNATFQNWSKSSAFMAYASHGCAVVSKVESDVAPLCFTVRPEEVETIADADLGERARLLNEWYKQNADWKVIAQKISALLSANLEQRQRRDR
jgi:hypothetical protein